RLERVVQVDDAPVLVVREEPGEVHHLAGGERGVLGPPHAVPALAGVGRLQVDALLGRVGVVEPDLVGVVERADVVPRAFQVRQAECGERGPDGVGPVAAGDVLVLRDGPRRRGGVGGRGGGREGDGCGEERGGQAHGGRFRREGRRVSWRAGGGRDRRR